MQEDNINNKYIKQKIAIEYIIKGLAEINPEYNQVLKSFEIAKKYHSGLRKDAKTPEFKHQLNIVGSILNYRKILINPIETLIAAFMHDVIEDYSYGSKIWESESEKERLKKLPYYNTNDLKRDFGYIIVKSNNCLSKTINGIKKNQKQYFNEMSLNPEALIVKSEDRLDNLNSMFFVFTLKKQRDYANEVFNYFIPALKVGEIKYPEQSNVYQMLKMRLKEKANNVLNEIDTFEKLGLDLNKTINENLKK